MVHFSHSLSFSFSPLVVAARARKRIWPWNVELFYIPIHIPSSFCSSFYASLAFVNRAFLKGGDPGRLDLLRQHPVYVLLFALVVR